MPIRSETDIDESPDFAVLYQELRSAAARQLRSERRDHTLQATALVHEVYLRMSQSQPGLSADRAAFLGIAAHVMRQVLVDHARERLRQKRGGGARRITLAETQLVSNRDWDVDIVMRP